MSSYKLNTIFFDGWMLKCSCRYWSLGDNAGCSVFKLKISEQYQIRLQIAILTRFSLNLTRRIIHDQFFNGFKTVIRCKELNNLSIIIKFVVRQNKQRLSGFIKRFSILFNNRRLKFYKRFSVVHSTRSLSGIYSKMFAMVFQGTVVIVTRFADKNSKK